MVEFYRELGPSGRCMWWGVAIMMIMFLTAWGTGIPEMYGAGCITIVFFGIGAALARIDI